ncbi:ATP-binding cassette domain-containing protein [Spiroplasma sp. BIUS-1]|uniref:ATP-binding cassette domain-containing protein n=1 Tax=Spiroplasma sp. BIUS-1 TaxID=216964 RepID=UPI001397A5D1|nr:ATP-binding cassette domain-containing protein [Spiroplasma sp. BIUS-1]QHX36575.1 ABC transporter ATP-binding protein [Spiroplasma sp. BIUS-1]
MIKINKINKKFGEKTVLKNITFNLEKGKCYGIFGNNGVGKTTLTKIVFNEIIADSGEITLDEVNQKEIDYLKWYFFVENNELPADISVISYIKIIMNTHNIKNSDLNYNIETFKSFLDINLIKNTLIKKISAGQKKLLSLFIMVLLKPKVIFFDEPTANLDIANKDLLLKVIQQTIGPETYVIIITHLIEEVKDLIDHIIIIDDGEVTYDKKYDKQENITKIFRENTKNLNKDIEKIMGVSNA